MSYFTVPSGAPIPLNLQLYDGDTTKFVRAYVFDASTELAVSGSPFTLAHFASGLYLNNLNVLSDGRYFVTYIVYDDAGFTIESQAHTREADYFEVDPTVAETADIFTKVQRLPVMEAKIDGIAVGGSPSSVAAAVWNANKSAYDIPGTFGWTNSGDMTQVRAQYLDNLQRLDVLVSTRATQADMQAGFSTVALDATVAKQSLLNTVNTKLGSPTNATFAADIAQIQSEVVNILAQTGTTGVVVSSAAIDAIANKVWDTTLALHIAAGTAGEKLSLTASGGIVTPADIANIVNAVWDEPMSAHLTAFTAGAYQNLIPLIKASADAVESRLTPSRAAKLDNLDVAVSTREAESAAASRSSAELAAIAAVSAVDSAIQTIVNSLSVRVGSPVNGSLAQDIAIVNSDTDYIQGKVAGLPSDPASQSAIASALAPISSTTTNTLAGVNAVKAKTDNLPANPAKESSVQAIPTNPLLTTDTRLNRLDAAISSRATAADLANLATQAGLTAVQAAIQADLANVLAAIAPKATTAQLNAAVAPLATQILLQATKTAVDNLASSSLTASQVWTHTPRTLSAPVDTTLDISGLATAVQLAATQNAIINALPKQECQMGVSIDPDTDQFEAEAWMVQDGSVLTDRTSCGMSVYRADGTLAFSIAPVTGPSAQGVFRLIYNGVSAVLDKNKAYVAVISISKGADVKTSVKSFTVF